MSKYDYSNLDIPTELQRKNGVYMLVNEDNSKIYIGKTDDKDNGFRQRYGTYLHNQAHEKCVGSGNKLFQSEPNVKMKWLFHSDPNDFDTIEMMEWWFIRQFIILHPEKLVNIKLKPSYGVMNRDGYDYINHDNTMLNRDVMLEFGLLRVAPHYH